MIFIFGEKKKGDPSCSWKILTLTGKTVKQIIPLIRGGPQYATEALERGSHPGLGQIGFLYYVMSKSSPKGKLEIVKSGQSGEVKSNDIPG